MSADIRQLNPSEFSQETIDRLIFAVTGRSTKLSVVNKPMRIAEACAFLGVSERTFRRLMNSGVIKTHRLEGLETNFFLPEELYDLIKKS